MKLCPHCFCWTRVRAVESRVTLVKSSIPPNTNMVYIMEFRNEFIYVLRSVKSSPHFRRNKLSRFWWFWGFHGRNSPVVGGFRALLTGFKKLTFSHVRFAVRSWRHLQCHLYCVCDHTERCVGSCRYFCSLARSGLLVVGFISATLHCSVLSTRDVSFWPKSFRINDSEKRTSCSESFELYLFRFRLQLFQNAHHSLKH